MDKRVSGAILVSGGVVTAFQLRKAFAYHLYILNSQQKILDLQNPKRIKTPVQVAIVKWHGKLKMISDGLSFEEQTTAFRRATHKMAKNIGSRIKATTEQKIQYSRNAIGIARQFRYWHLFAAAAVATMTGLVLSKLLRQFKS